MKDPACHGAAKPVHPNHRACAPRSPCSTTREACRPQQGLKSHRSDDPVGEEAMGTVRDFIFLGSKITADGDCSQEIKRRLLLGRKVMTNLDSILKSRDITLLTKVHLVKAMVFPGVMYGCESWTIMKAEHRRIDAFEL